MGRPGVYGRELKTTYDGRFIALNLGYNFYTEHEYGVKQIVDSINMYYANPRMMQQTLSMLRFSPVAGDEKKKATRVLKQKRDECKKGWVLIRKKYVGNLSQFQPYVLNPAVNIQKREIRINNKPIEDQYTRFLTRNGDYTYVCIGSSQYIDKIKDKPSCTERDLLFMDDYNHSRFFGSINSFIPVCGSWMTGSSDIRFLIYRNPLIRDIGKQVIEALKRGSLAVVSELNGVMQDRGCILVDVDAFVEYMGQY